MTRVEGVEHKDADDQHSQLLSQNYILYVYMYEPWYIYIYNVYMIIYVYIYVSIYIYICEASILLAISHAFSGHRHQSCALSLALANSPQVHPGWEIVWNRARMNGYASNKIDHFIWSFWSDQWLFPQINEWQVLNQDMVHQATCVSLNISDLIITQFFTTVLAQNTSYKY